MSVFSSSFMVSMANAMNRNAASMAKSMERIATGSRLNHASDGAANIQISAWLNSQIRGMDAASTNVQQGLSMMEIADGALQQMAAHLQNLRDIAVAADNDSFLTTAEKATYNAQITAEVDAINQIANNASYGSINLLTGSAASSAFSLQIGPNSGDTLDVSGAFATSTAQALNGGAAIASAGQASTLISQVDTMIGNLGVRLAKVGGFENQLQNQMNYLAIASENMTAADESIRLADVAAETANISRRQILQQAGAIALTNYHNNLASVYLKLLE